MRAITSDAITEYQFRAAHGMSFAEYNRQQKIIARYGSLKVYEQHMELEKEWEMKRRELESKNDILEKILEKVAACLI